MADNEISILVKAEVAKALDNLKQVKEAPEDIKKGFAGLAEKAKQQFAVVAAAGVAMYATLKKAGQSIKIAAEFAEQSEAVEKQFGVTTTALLSTLRTASKGMIADVDLLKLASRAMALGVSTDIKTLGDIFQFADIKSKTLGKSVDETFSLIVEGVGRQNPKMLKELGFTSTALKTMADGTEAVLSKNQLLDIVMKEAAGSIKKYGDETLSSADQLAIFEASSKNLEKQMGDALLPVFNAIIPSLKGIVSLFMAAPAPLKVMGVAMLALVPAAVALWASLGPVGLVLGAIGLVAGAFALKLGQITQAEEELEKKTNELKKQFDKGAFETQNVALERFKNQIKGANEELLNMIEAQAKNGMYLDANGRFQKAANADLQAWANLQALAAIAERERVKQGAANNQTEAQQREAKRKQEEKDAEDREKARQRREADAATYDAFLAADKTAKEIAELEKRKASALAAADALGRDRNAIIAAYDLQLAEIEKQAAIATANEWVTAFSAVSAAASAWGDFAMQIVKNQVDAENVGGKKITEEQKKRLKDAAIAQKALAVFNAVINGASAVIAALATPFAGPFLAIAAGATAAAQTATILAQPLPEFALGGIVNGPQAIIAGERGREAVLPNDLTELLLSAAGQGRGGATVNIGQVVANDPQQFAAAINRHIRTRGNLLSI